jgi:Signal transduction histidine kinase
MPHSTNTESLPDAKKDTASGGLKPCVGYALMPEEIRQNCLVFLHDILNSASGLQGFLELMTETEDPEKLKKYTMNSFMLCDSLVEEIHYHREFLLSESEQLEPVFEEARIQDVLEFAVLKLKSHKVSKGRTIEIVETSAESISTDKVLLSRILVNMVKNAVEAVDAGESVQIGAAKFDDKVRFWVHNSSVIPKEVQNHIFEIPSSTKGKNRGIGLFSVRLLGENALGGHVWFESTPEKGTSFYIDLPLQPND